MKKLVCLLVLSLLVCGCHAKESVKEQTSNETASMNSFDEGYYKIVKLENSELREDFYNDYGTTSDFKTIGRGLQLLSSEYFSTKDYYMSEGQYLGIKELYQLIRRDSDPTTYPYTLQPAKGTKIENVDEPIMVSNIQEQDYYVKEGNNYILKGVSFSIILHPLQSDGQTLSTPFSDSVIESYGKEIIPKFYKFIREYASFEKIRDLPILVTVYQATDLTSSTVDGNYILKSYCQKGEQGTIQNVNFENVIFASSRAEEIDSVTSSEFDIIKQSLKDAAIEAAGLQGTARYIDGKIQSMIINANLNVKSYTELLYLTSRLADQIDNQFSYDFDIKVLVKSQDELQAVIIKNKGEKIKSEILY